MDWVVVTASNDEQAEFYESEISSRKMLDYCHKNKIYSSCRHQREENWFCGATLNVIKENQGRTRKIDNLKILVLHSGG